MMPGEMTGAIRKAGRQRLHRTNYIAKACIAQDGKTNMNIADKLTKTCPRPSAWRREKRNEKGFSKAELGYFRCDYDGYKWWTTVWPVNKELEEPELATEFNAVLASFLETFPTLSDLRKYCNARFLPHERAFAIDAFLDLDGPGLYWLRIRLPEKDYNLYLHCISKKAIAEDDK